MAYQKSELDGFTVEESYQTGEGPSKNNLENKIALDESTNSGNEGLGGFFFKHIPISTKKLPLTIIYCMSFWNFGICVAIFGPTLLDLACQTSSTLSAMSLLYFMQNFTSLLGCFVSGMCIKNKK